MSFERDDIEFYVVKNMEEQYSIWPSFKAIPSGWEDVGFKGLKADCMEYIEKHWTDMRPLSLRKHMENMSAKAG